MTRPLFIVSLDLELYWGVRDSRTLQEYGDNLIGSRAVIPRLLELFCDRGIHATWAAVGFLMLRDAEDVRAHLPACLPGYRARELCPYAYLERERDALRADVHFAPELVERIVATPGQELATHTFSHFYGLEAPRDLEAFRADLQAARAVAKSRFGVDVRSLVFPRNQYTPDHVRVAGEVGITAYRGNPRTWMYAPRARSEESLVRRAARLLDAYAPLVPDLTFAPLAESLPVNVPASRFLRPWSRALERLERLRIRRVQREMELAAQRGRAYHLWWHPHNFGSQLEENLAGLSSILATFGRLRRTYGMTSITMGEVAAAMAAPDRSIDVC
jgi:peptidoglycan/xylan/chitin deacetylase (PgdA/CDA1 family)